MGQAQSSRRRRHTPRNGEAFTSGRGHGVDLATEYGIARPPDQQLNTESTANGAHTTTTESSSSYSEACRSSFGRRWGQRAESSTFASSRHHCEHEHESSQSTLYSTPGNSFRRVPAAHPVANHSPSTVSDGAVHRMRSPASDQEVSSMCSNNMVSLTASYGELLQRMRTSLSNVGLLNSCHIMLGVGFSSTNLWSGQRTFGRCMHGVHSNCHWATPYEEVIMTLGRTVDTLNGDNVIPCYGFGDCRTLDKSIFPWYKDGHPCQGFDEVHRRYRFIAQHVVMGLRSSFAPIIHHAIREVQNQGFQYHILVLMSDGIFSKTAEGQTHPPRGQGWRRGRGRGSAGSAGSESEEFNQAEWENVAAIVEASNYPMSIIYVGVGDGTTISNDEPWKYIERYTKGLSVYGQKFNNFTFVNYAECMKSAGTKHEQEACLAFNILKDIPRQYMCIQALYANMLQGHHIRQNTSPAQSVQLQPLPKEIVSADKSYKKRFSPLSAHIRKSDNGIDVSQISESTVSTSSHTMDGPSESPSAPSIDFCGDTSDMDQSHFYVSKVNDVPAIFICPITQELMVNPVIAEDGFTYECEAFERWTKNHNRSPMTNESMKSIQTIQNHALRSAICEWQERNAICSL